MRISSLQAGLATCVWLLVALSLPANGQVVGNVSVTGPRARFGADVDLHRVRGAAILPDGRVAIADGGNARVLVFRASGSVERTFGRLGYGPDDFQMLYNLTAVGDTLVTWDSGLNRIVLWKPDGAIIRSVSLPAVSNHVVDVQAIRSSTEYIATLRTGTIRPANGLYLDTMAVISVNAHTEKPTELGRHAWSYSYFQASGGGSSSYLTPFLGTTLIAASAGKVLTLPLGQATVTVKRSDGVEGNTVRLPISRVDSRSRAKAYGDSLIASVRDRDPGWVSRIHSVFGPDFPTAAPAVAQRAVAVGSSVWFQTFPEPRDSVTAWFIVDARQEKLVGRISLQRSAVVLGGNDRQVLVLLRDDDGVETVGLFDITISR